jgi:hypothetical protein
VLEVASEIGNVDSIYFPYIDNLFSVFWFIRREDISLVANCPLDSRALLLETFVGNEKGIFLDQNRKKFNQIIKNPLELDMNPFRNWKDRFFTREQLDYLFYWREAAYELSDQNQRDIFWAAVYFIMQYWLSNRGNGVPCKFKPDQIMDIMLDRQAKSSAFANDNFSLLKQNFDDLEAKKAALAVIPLEFEVDGNDEPNLETIFHSWFHGHSDCDHARREIRNTLNKFKYSFTGKENLNKYLEAVTDSKFVVFLWNGVGLPPGFYEQEVILPLKETFADKFKKSEFRIKAIDPSQDEYDYLLLFHN